MQRLPAEIARIRAERNGEPVLAMAPAAPAAVPSGASNYTGVTNTAGDGPEIEAIAMTVPVNTAPSALTVQNLKPLAILQGSTPSSAAGCDAVERWAGRRFRVCDCQQAIRCRCAGDGAFELSADACVGAVKFGHLSSTGCFQR